MRTPSIGITYPIDPLRVGSRIGYPFDPLGSGRSLDLHYPLPEIRDVNGDGLPDLVMPHHRTRWKHFQVMVNGGGGRFDPPRAPLGAYGSEKAKQEKPKTTDQEEDSEIDKEEGRVVFFGDLDGDGRAEYVIEDDRSSSDAGWRKELKEAKRPPFHYRLYHMTDDFEMAGEPYAEFDTLGYAFESDGSDEENWIPGGSSATA